MKYIKTYEGLSHMLYRYFKNRSDKYTKYKRNTYILTTDGKVGKIGAVDHGNVDLYWLESDDPDDNDPISDSDIVREATPEEIEQYKIEQDAKKYNI